jgi:hypothetical protein
MGQSWHAVKRRKANNRQFLQGLKPSTQEFSSSLKKPLPTPRLEANPAKSGCHSLLTS